MRGRTSGDAHEGDPTPDHGAARRTGPRGVRGGSRARLHGHRHAGPGAGRRSRPSGIPGSGLDPGATIGICQAIQRTPPAIDDCGATTVGSPIRTGHVDELFTVERLMLVRSVGREVDCLVDPCELRISEIPDFLNPAFVPISLRGTTPPPVRPLVTTLTGYREGRRPRREGRRRPRWDRAEPAITFPDVNRLCFRLEASGIALPALAAHIHSGGGARTVASSSR